MFPLGRFLTGEHNDYVKVENNICLNWKPAPGIQAVASVEIKIVDVEYFHHTRIQEKTGCGMKERLNSPQASKMADEMLGRTKKFECM